ncbi:hypothetical protein AHiyo1_42260 [Arthrobacter sp. Hiyo1]|nr:hypothetical protein AHiyo1_42260 [Arthrobacter sp. Hiyo1]
MAIVVPAPAVAPVGKLYADLTAPGDSPVGVVETPGLTWSG